MFECNFDLVLILGLFSLESCQLVSDDDLLVASHPRVDADTERLILLSIIDLVAVQFTLLFVAVIFFLNLVGCAILKKPPRVGLNRASLQALANLGLSLNETLS